MRFRQTVTTSIGLLALWLVTERCAGGPSEIETVRQASRVLEQIMAIPARAIPQQLLSNAQAVAIIPDVKGGAFVIGVRRGRGVLVTRDDAGGWQMPQFVDLTGGSVGWQAGIQSTDVVLVFRSRETLENLMKGKLTIGVDASVAAGPLGRQAAAATDLPLKSEIYSYSRSRGAFLGVSIEGSVLKPDLMADRRFYQSSNVIGQPETVPAVAGQLVGEIARFADGSAAPLPANAAPISRIEQVSMVRRQLAEAWQRLSPRLDPSWQEYLVLPGDAFAATANLQPDSLASTLRRYETVAANPQYSTLTRLTEFQTVYKLLGQLTELSRTPVVGQLQLPPPPSAGRRRRI